MLLGGPGTHLGVRALSSLMTNLCLARIPLQDAQDGDNFRGLPLIVIPWRVLIHRRTEADVVKGKVRGGVECC